MNENNQNPQDISPKIIEVFRDSIFENFSDVKDPRKRDSRIRHTLSNIFFISLCAVLCGANNLKEIATYAQSKEQWLKSILELPYGVPSHVTFWWFFVMLSPDLLNEAFVNWVGSLSTLTKGKVIAIDGKASRGTAKKGKANSFAHMVSLWACDQGITLGQLKVEGKLNEITAIPKVLSLIDVSGSIITIDAMGTQVKIAKAIQNAGADYILALKGNQSNLNNEVQNFFRQAEGVNFEGTGCNSYHMTEERHGRKEKRVLYVTEDIDWLPQINQWEGLRSIAMIISERVIDGKKSYEKRFYISSLEANPRLLAYSIRTHWRIENQCHWVLDVGFREDAQKANTGHIPENLSIVRRMALNLLRQDKKTKAGIEIKRKKAGWSPEYLLQLLGVKSF